MITIFCEIRLLKLPSPSELGASRCRLCTALLRPDLSYFIKWVTTSLKLIVLSPFVSLSFFLSLSLSLFLS